MKWGKCVVVTTFALIVSLSAFARDNNRGKMVLSQPAVVGSTQLQPGTYDVQWTGSGPALNVNFLQHDKVVASAQGELKNEAGVRQDAVLFKLADNSSQRTLVEVDFGNRHESLQITPNSSNPPDQTQTR